MKTVLIFDQCGEQPLQFFVVEGDYQHLDSVYINATDDEALEDELNSLLYDEAGKLKLKPIKGFPYKAVKSGAKVIVVGFAP